ncbi:MAG TPA: response regulator transcription factor [Alphaproteobacteria bacterium]|nr:response regulator transcription factor [Alphaproteobacteria bacterium]
MSELPSADTASPAEADAPHVLVVDDDRRLRDLLQRYLSENGFRVTTAGDAALARAKLASLAFDLIVLDVMMPGESGLDLTASLRQQSRVPILLLTAMGEAEDRIRGLERGADDYLPKPFEPRELVLRIKTILTRVREPAPRPTPPQLLRFGDYLFAPGRDELRKGADILRLTTGEAALLRALAETPGAPVSREELSRRVNGNGTGNDSADASATRAIDVQVTRLRRKIEPDPKEPRYLQTVRGQGYILRPD